MVWILAVLLNPLQTSLAKLAQVPLLTSCSPATTTVTRSSVVAATATAGPLPQAVALALGTSASVRRTWIQPLATVAGTATQCVVLQSKSSRLSAYPIPRFPNTTNSKMSAPALILLP